MADVQPLRRRIRQFDDLRSIDDETLRQVAMRVHVVDLAYAFMDDEELLKRLFGAISNGLAHDIKAAIATVKAESERFQSDVAVRTARARVMEIVRETLDAEEAP